MENKIDKFKGKYHFLSNFHHAYVVHEGILYENNEAAFQANKLKDVLKRNSFSHLDPSLAKRKGRRVNLRDDWEDIKDNVMYEVCLAKFTQNPHLKSKLLETGDSILIEGNTWNDTYWGVCKGKGKNMLGKILMKVREEIK